MIHIIGEMTVYLTVTALFLLIFKRLFKNKLSSKWQVWIWALLLVRFAVPNLPASNISVFNAVPLPQSAGIVQGGEAEPGNNTPKLMNVLEHSEIEINAETPAMPAETMEENVVLWIWTAGAVGFILYFLTIYGIYSFRSFRNSVVADENIWRILEECKKLLKIRSNVRIFTCDESPTLIGIICPRIIIPEGYSDEEVKNIIIHELCHLKGRDVILIWVATFVLCLNWFNPVMWYSFFVFRRDIEVYCDSRAVEYSGNKKNYAALLLKTALGKNRFVVGTTSLQNGEKEVERRIKYIAQFKKPKILWTAVIVIVAVIISAVCLTNSASSATMSEQRFTEFSEKMVGSTMAEIGYADGNKVVFYYTDGIFVYDFNKREITKAFDMSTLNCAQHQQGSYGLQITVTQNGKSAFLINYGLEDEIGGFDNYILNLENGRVKKTDLLKAENPFADRKDSFTVIPDAKGWFSISCVELEDSVVYLTNRTSSLQNIKIVIRNKKDKSETEFYPFRQELNEAQAFLSFDIKELVWAKLLLADGSEYIVEDNAKLKRIEQMLRAAKKSTVSDCPFDTEIFMTRADGVTGRITIASDSCCQYIGANNTYYDYGDNNLRLIRLFGLKNWPHHSTETLYSQTESYLYDAFYEKYSPYYEILDLTIKNWQEDGDEATFFYYMTHKNYDKDPDTVPYIKEAKERGEYIYETYKKEYLEPKTGMYDLKVVRKDGDLKFFANVAGKGKSWQAFDVSAEAAKNEYYLVPKDDNRQFEWPCPSSYEITKSFTGKYNHQGVDIKAEKGAPVVSATAGTITEAGYNKEMGNYIVLSDEAGIVTRYAHLDEIVAKQGTKAGKNQVIGKVGQTGLATGPHLHFEIMLNGEYIDPNTYF